MKEGKKKRIVGLLVLCCMLMLMPLSVSAKAKTSVAVFNKGKTKIERSYKVKSSNKKVVEVKKQGKSYRIMPKREGEAVLSYYKGNKLKKKVYVLVADGSTFKYNASKLTLQQGKSKAYRFNGYKKCTVKFSSSNKKVAKVSSKGNIKGVKKGKATIYAKIYYRGKNVKTYKKPVVVTSKKTSSSSSSSSETLLGIRTVPELVEIPRFEQFKPSMMKVYAIYKKSGKTYERLVTDYTTDYKPKGTFGTSKFNVIYKGKRFPVRYRIKEEDFTSSTPYYGKPYVIIEEGIDPDAIYTIDQYSRENANGTWTKWKERGKPISWEWVPSPVHGQKGELTFKVKDRSPRGWILMAAQIPCYSRDSYKSLTARLTKGIFAPGEDIRRSLTVSAVTLDGRTVNISDYSMSFASQTRPGKYNLDITAKAYNGEELKQTLTVTVQ